MNKKKLPIFISCLGAQKAGTTWLYFHLLGNNLINSSVKEIAAVRPGNPNDAYDRVIKLRKAIDQYTSVFESRIGHRKKTKMSTKKKFLHDICKQMYLMNCALYPDEYASHFKTLSAQNPELAVGDFCPDYAFWRENEIFDLLMSVANSFEIRGIYLLRDPIERLYSWSKHKINRLTKDCHVSADDDFHHSIQNLDSYEYRSSQYEEILPKLKRVFARLRTETNINHEIKFMFNDHMFTQDGLNKLSEHIKCRNAKGNFSKKINEDPNDTKLPDIALKQAQPLFHLTYKYTLAEMGYLPKNWHFKQP